MAVITVREKSTSSARAKTSVNGNGHVNGSGPNGGPHYRLEDTPTVAVGPSIVARGDLCAASLPDGRVLTSGGRRDASDTGFSSSGVVELMTPTANVKGGVLGMLPLKSSRYLHTCTPLPDGSVLIAGGLDASDAGAQLSSGTYIFMPVPRD